MGKENNNYKKTYKKSHKNNYLLGDNDEYLFCTNINIDEIKNPNLTNVNLRYYFQKVLLRKKDKDKDKIQFIRCNLYEKKKFCEIKTNNNNYKEALEEYCMAIDYRLAKLEGDITYKLSVGLGNPSTSETSLTLHHIYGVPYIPAQSIKGAIRNYFLSKYTLHKDEEISIGNVKIATSVLYKYIFGEDYYDENNNVLGHVIFFDSYAEGNIEIEKDVMTPHYAGYDGKNLPTDNIEPNPIPFYIIKNTQFLFEFAISKDDIIINDGHKEIMIKCDVFIENIKEIMMNGLEEHGLGAKTSVGYGYFRCEHKK